MGNLTIFEKIIDKKINSIHTAFLADVISVDSGVCADIQPLVNGAPILRDVVICRSIPGPIEEGDVVVCVCCKDNISTAKKGKMPTSLEPTQKFSYSNSLIIGIL